MKCMALVCFVMICSMLTACTKDAVQENAESSISVPEATESNSSFAYNGTFDEEVFSHICQDISINGVRVTVPGNLADWGEGFSTELLFRNPDTLETCYEVFYGSERVAAFYSDATESDADSYYQLMLDGGGFSSTITKSAAGIETCSNSKSILAILGEPTEIYDPDESDQDFSYTYRLNEHQRISFVLLDDEISSISIENR